MLKLKHVCYIKKLGIYVCIGRDGLVVFMTKCFPCPPPTKKKATNSVIVIV